MNRAGYPDTARTLVDEEILEDTPYRVKIKKIYSDGSSHVSNQTKKCSFCEKPRTTFKRGNGSLADHIRHECEVAGR